MRFTLLDSRVDGHEKVCCILSYKHPRGLKPSPVSGLYDPVKPDQSINLASFSNSFRSNGWRKKTYFPFWAGRGCSKFFALTKMEENARERLTSFRFVYFSLLRSIATPNGVKDGTIENSKRSLQPKAVGGEPEV